MAGIGWQGKNLLLITQKYGSRVPPVPGFLTSPVQQAQSASLGRSGRNSTR